MRMRIDAAQSLKLLCDITEKNFDANFDTMTQIQNDRGYQMHQQVSGTQQNLREIHESV